eukprot:388493_1
MFSADSNQGNTNNYKPPNHNNISQNYNDDNNINTQPQFNNNSNNNTSNNNNYSPPQFDNDNNNDNDNINNLIATIVIICHQIIISLQIIMHHHITTATIICHLVAIIIIIWFQIFMMISLLKMTYYTYMRNILLFSISFIVLTPAIDCNWVIAAGESRSSRGNAVTVTFDVYYAKNLIGEYQNYQPEYDYIWKVVRAGTKDCGCDEDLDHMTFQVDPTVCGCDGMK